MAKILKVMKLPFISIIIPTFNEKFYIEGTLKSIIDQNYSGKYEIIVADGNSKDNTVAIAKRYTDKTIILKERGIAIGRNAGAKIAKGNILVFIDADTILLPNTLYELVRPLVTKNLIGTTCPIIPLSNKIQDFVIYRLLNEYVKLSIKLGKAHIPGTCIACTREAFITTGGFDSKLNTVEDTDFSIKLSKLGKIEYVDKTKILTSVRRLEKWGRIKAVLFYSTTYFKYLFKRNIYSVRKFEAIR